LRTLRRGFGKKSEKTLDFFYRHYGRPDEGRFYAPGFFTPYEGEFYTRQRYLTLNPNVRTDLTLLVPTLTPTTADVLALAELELAKEQHKPVGNHTPEALALLERARKAFGTRA